MIIFIEKDDRKVSKRFAGTVASLLSSLDINPETVLVSRNGEIVTEDVVLKDSDDIKILSVVSGG